jgi:hypothetical protein
VTILLKRGANGRVVAPLEPQVISRSTSASPSVRQWSGAIPARQRSQTALAEKLIKAIETIAGLGRPDRRPSKPEKKAGRRRA